MILATNCDIKSKDDLIKVSRLYLDRWRKVYLWFYRFSRGIFNILKMAYSGIKEWQNIRKIKVFDG